MNQTSTYPEMLFDIVKVTVQARSRALSAQWTLEDTRQSDPVFHDLGLIETACLQYGDPNWDGYRDEIEHYYGDGVEDEIVRLLQEELKKNA